MKTPRLGEGRGWPCPVFASHTMAFALQLRKYHGKPSIRLTEGRSADQHRTRFVFSSWPSRAIVSTDLLAPAAFGFRVRQRSQPSFSVSTCRVAVLGGSPHQLTFSQRSQLWVGCCRKIAVLRDREGVETHIRLPIKRPQCADRGSEPVGG